MALNLPCKIDLNSICHLHKLHQRNDLAEIMCLGQYTPKPSSYILVDDLPEEVSSYVIFGALVQMLIFRDLGFSPLAENASMF